MVTEYRPETEKPKVIMEAEANMGIAMRVWL
jgi:hypothetical protein